MSNGLLEHDLKAFGIWPLPPSWSVNHLGQLANICTGKKDTQNRVDGGKYPFFVRSQTIERIDTYSYDGVAVLTAGDGVGTGKVFHFIDGKFDYHQRVYKISAFHPELVPRYFFEYFRHFFIRQVSRFTAKSSVDSVRMEMLSMMAVPLPPIGEQRKIAAILSTWDRGIDLIEKLIIAKQNRKNALMQLLFSGKMRLPKFKGLKWKKCHLGDVATNSSGRNGKPTQSRIVYSVTNSVGMIPMDEGVIGESIERYKTVSRFDFAYNPMRINVGSIAMWNGDDDVLVSPDYVVFRCGPELDAEFLNHYRKSNYWHQFVNSSGGGSVRVRIYFSDLADMKLKLPPIDEQKAIAAVLNTQDKELELLRRKCSARKEQKKGLMQRLLTGRVRVDLNSELVKV